jgi:hypothetical protein
MRNSYDFGEEIDFLQRNSILILKFKPLFKNIAKYHG